MKQKVEYVQNIQKDNFANKDDLYLQGVFSILREKTNRNYTYDKTIGVNKPLDLEVLNPDIKFLSFRGELLQVKNGVVIY